jgi:hypothetical protein
VIVAEVGSAERRVHFLRPGIQGFQDNNVRRVGRRSRPGVAAKAHGCLQARIVREALHLLLNMALAPREQLDTRRQFIRWERRRQERKPFEHGGAPDHLALLWDSRRRVATAGTSQSGKIVNVFPHG